MKTTLIILALLFSLFVIYFFILGFNSKSKVAPGLTENHLANCPNTPNCVSSENEQHINHYITPISLTQKNYSIADTLLMLKDIVRDMGGTIQLEKKNYIAATFTSAIFGFVDDLEIRIDSTQNMTHFRSASRVGRSDLGVNKKRVQLVKQLYRTKTISDINN
ncbi:MAG: DUF1499 domain-containing protein [Gammaproteobacteria bacterium]|nr:DUF1499 domain-containing protein [Gammaproteobacteria bacterium]MCW8986581.1 DUF1499 domain-containing protein [Gammaproteobacteria bacterium]